jgi:hypothetical protein
VSVATSSPPLSTQSCALNPTVDLFVAGPSGEKSVKISWSPVPEAHHYRPSLTGVEESAGTNHTLILHGKIETKATEIIVDWWTIDDHPTVEFEGYFHGFIEAVDINNRRICKMDFDFYR